MQFSDKEKKYTLKNRIKYTPSAKLHQLNGFPPAWFNHEIKAVLLAGRCVSSSHSVHL